jgi:putative endonuclease
MWNRRVEGGSNTSGMPTRPGGSGETAACRHLEAAGLTIRQRNFRCHEGEIDIVAQDGATTVFVEVKERHASAHGLACETVTPGQRRRIVRAARVYGARHGLSERPIRFDVVSIDWMDDEHSSVRHDRGAFDADGR